MYEKEETTALLKRWQEGDSAAFEQLINRVYNELKDLAHKKLLDEFHGSGLQTTELLNEACILMMGKRKLDLKSRKHFMHTAGIAMYRFLVDEARKRKTQRKGGELAQHDLEDRHEPLVLDVEKVLAVQQLLEELKQEDAILVEIAKLRYFAGYTIKETAEILDLPTITVNRKWAFAKAVLSERVKGDKED